MTNPRLIIFDVNETLLDMSPLLSKIGEKFQNHTIAELWFSKLLHFSLVETTSGNYNDFTEIAKAILKMLAEENETELKKSEIEEILKTVRNLKSYPDVKPGLSKLNSSGYNLVALSNGKPDVLKDQLQNAGIADLFKSFYSIEDVKKYKPHAATYNYVLDTENTDATSALFVAAHGWDLYGAQSNGLSTAFVKRPGKALYPLAKKPDFTFSTIEELAQKFCN